MKTLANLWIGLTFLVSASSCKEDLMKSKNRYIREFDAFVSLVEKQSEYFIQDSDWELNDAEFARLSEDLYWKYAEYLNSYERDQIIKIRYRYKNAKSRYYLRRVQERLDLAKDRVMDFLDINKPEKVPKEN